MSKDLVKERNRDAEDSANRETAIHARYADLIKAAQHAQRWIKMYRSSVVGSTGDAVLNHLSRALKEVDAK